MSLQSAIRAALLLGSLAALGCGSIVLVDGDSGSAAGTGSSSSGGSGGGGGSGGAGTTSSGGDPVKPVPEGSHRADYGYFDAVLDTERDRVFLSYRDESRVDVVDLHDGSVAHVKAGWKAEFLHFDAVRDQVIVALPFKDHSSYWWPKEQEGHIAAIDATTLIEATPIWIPMDPWQVVSDGAGHVYTSGGSGQWTTIMSIDLATGTATTMSGSNVYEKTNLRIHPSFGRIYGADSGSSPSDLERFNLASGAVSYGYDSPYHGDYPMCNDLRIHADGSTIYTPCGNVFRAGDSQSSDMTWVGDLGVPWKDIAFNPSSPVAYALRDDNAALQEIDTVKLTLQASHQLSAPAARVFAGPSYLVLVRRVYGEDPHTEIEVISYSSL
jgi:serine protease Do